MDEPRHNDNEDAQAGASSGIGALISSLREAGAARFDPARLQYLEVLATRATAHQGAVRRILDAKLAKAVEEFKERFERARSETEKAIEQSAQVAPQAAKELQQHLAAGEFKEVRRLLGAPKDGEHSPSLGELVRHLEHYPPASAHVRAPSPGESRPELKTISKFRNTWSKLSVDKQVAKALEQAPKNAGPINSHMLVLRSLALMRDISPDYLNRFISYADTLLALDQGEKDKPAAPKKPGVRAAKK